VGGCGGWRPDSRRFQGLGIRNPCETEAVATREIMKARRVRYRSVGKQLARHDVDQFRN
jgi:hypothetical protein